MKRERKEALLSCFPAIEAEQLEQMKGKGAKNFVIFLTYGRELFARCFHRYSNGEIAERQRYVFAKDGCVRYGNDKSGWKIRCEFREPVFYLSSYEYTLDNSYYILGEENIKRSDMRYSQYNMYRGKCLMRYLELYCKHPNLEYLMKQNFDPIEEYYTGWWGRTLKLRLSNHINWKSNNLLKMLGINKNELKLLKGKEYLYDTYIDWREQFPKLQPEEIFYIADVFRNEHGTMARFTEATGLAPQRIARYISENEIATYDYNDYISQCADLQYDMRDTAISMPHDFNAMHGRLSAILKYRHNEKVKQAFAEHYDERKPLEFADGNLVILQPSSIDDIAAEGAALCHCVGGYAERHANGVLNIMFIRKKDKPDKPYYTIEVSKKGEIVQVRGKHNVQPTEQVKQLVEQYKQYLTKLFRKKSRRKTA